MFQAILDMFGPELINVNFFKGFPNILLRKY